MSSEEGAIGPSASVALGRPWDLRLLAPLALAPVAVVAPEAVPWVLAGSLGMIATGTVARRPAAPSAMDAMHRHLTWCRRRGERANMLVLVVEPATPRSVAELLAATRVTDSFAVQRVGRRVRILGLLEGQALDRTVVERRLAACLDADAVCSLTWAIFPDDGLTLDVLLDHAQAAVLLTGRP
jgi:hypothetical protein